MTRTYLLASSSVLSPSQLPSSVANVSPGSSNELPTLFVPRPTGTAAIDTAAIQVIVNYAITGNATDTRTAPMSRTAALYRIEMQPGTYATNAPIKVYATLGLTMEGAGSLATVIEYQGSTVISDMLDVNGCSSCEIGHFGLNGGISTTHYPTTVLNVDAVASVSCGSSEFCHFYDMYLEGTYVNGLLYGGSGADNSQDVYHHEFEHVAIWGSQTAGLWNTATFWQTGIQLGKTGASGGNVLMPAFSHCTVDAFVIGVNHQGCGCIWAEGSLQDNQTDIHVAGVGEGDIISYSKFRGENSSRLLSSANGPGSCQQMSLRDIGWCTTYLASDDTPISWNLGGLFTVDDVALIDFNNGNMLVTAYGSNGPSTSKFTNFAITRTDGNPDPIAWLTPVPGAIAQESTWTVSQVSAVDGATGIITNTLAGPVSRNDWNYVQGNYAGKSRDRIAGYISGLPATYTLPVLSSVSLGHRVVIKDETNSAGTNHLTVATSGSDKFEDGTSSKAIAVNNGYIEVYAGYAYWMILSTRLTTSSYY